MSVEWWKSFFEIGGVVLLFLTFAFGAGFVLTGKIVSQRQETQLRQFDKDLTDAKNDLVKQQERAAKAEQDAAYAKTTAAQTSERATILEKDAAEANATQKRVEIDLARQQEKTATAERALLQLQRRMEPRRISADQRARLVEILSNGPKGKVSINCVLGDAEGQAFADDIDSVLKASGWDNSGVNQGVYSGGNPVGFGIVVRSAIDAPPYAVTLQRAFFSIGIPMAGAEKLDVPEGAVEILVGNKPN